ncbi:MAG: glycosyltransferase family 4 protein [Candidatus Bipolaricaulia bacterium]
MSRGRVVIATTVHPICDVRILYREARSLARAGYDVEVIGPSPAPESALGIEGVRLTLIPHEVGRFRRAVISGARLGRMLFKRRPDVVHLHDPELLWLGLVQRITGRRVVFDLHEDLPLQILAKEWIPRPLRRIASWVSAASLRLVAGRFAGLVAATDVVAKRLPARKRPVVVRNFPVIELMTSPKTRQDAATRFVYVGRISQDRGAAEMLRAVENLAHLDVRLALVGVASDDVREAVANSTAADRIELIPWEPPLRVYDRLSQADVGLVCLHPLQRYVDALPVKLFEYMAAGLPVIASDFPGLRAIVEEADCGLLVNPLDVHSLSEAMCRLAESPEERRRLGANGRRAIAERYNWRSEEAKLLELYARLLQPKTR